MENYAAIKARLLSQATKHAIIGVDDEFSSALFTRLAARGGAVASSVSVGKVLGRGIFVVDGVLYDAQSGRATEVMKMADAPHLPGAHNWQNAALAYGAVKPYVSDARQITSAIASFPGLAHRMEEVSQIGKVKFVNDSKATNADAAAAPWPSIPTFSGSLVARPKEGGIESLAQYFSRIRRAYLIGEAAPAFARSLDGKAPYIMSGTLDAAVAQAAQDAAESGAPRSRGAAVAGPAQLRPVQGFRAARRRLPHSGGPVAARHEGGLMNRATNTGFRQLVVHRRPRGAAVHAGAGRHRPDAGLRRQPRHHRRAADRRRLPLYARQVDLHHDRHRHACAVRRVSHCARSRLVAAVTFACALIGCFLVLFVGADVLGARRELNLGPFALQPSSS